MSVIQLLILIIGIVIISTLLFSIIYYIVKDDISLDTGLYYSVQIQTSIGALEIHKERKIRNIITIQSIIAFCLNIFLASILAFCLIRKVKGKPLNL